MKVFKLGDKGRAMCHRDGPVATTFDYRDVPFRDGMGVAKSILVGICDVCGDAVVIPSQSAAAVASARQRAEKSFEVNLPAVYIDVLDAAVSRIPGGVYGDFRKRLFMYYIGRYASGAEAPTELTLLVNDSWKAFIGVKNMPNKRFSMKLSEGAVDRVEKVLDKTSLNRTDLVKSIVAKIHADLVAPEKPRHLSELSMIADVMYA